MRIALLGYGNVGSALAAAFLGAGHAVTFATNPGNPDGARQAVTANPALAAATVRSSEEAVAAADLVVLAVPFGRIEDVLTPLRDLLTGTVLIDATNPVGANLTHGLSSREAGAQRVAALAPVARVVKAFSVYGFENLAVAPICHGGLRPAMLYAGDDAAAKSVVADLLTGLGWEPVDAGPLVAALDLEHLTLLWVRMVRVGGMDPHLVWAALRDRPAGATP
jgi:hypothetical protein